MNKTADVNETEENVCFIILILWLLGLPLLIFGILAMLGGIALFVFEPVMAILTFVCGVIFTAIGGGLIGIARYFSKKGRPKD